LKHRKTHSRSQAYSPPRSASPGTSAAPSGPFDFRFGQEQPETRDEEPEDEMDWIGDRISQLIEEGKKALGTEVVVMSDAKEDEVDDGSGAWEEEFDDRSIRSSRRKRVRTPRSIGMPRSYSPQRALSSPTSPGFSPSRSHHRSNTVAGPSPSFPTARAPSIEYESPTLPAASWKENEEDWQSLEIKASMEKARQLYLSRLRG